MPFAPEPIDIAYKANRFHLLSHVEYLSPSKGDDVRLVDIVAGWLVEGNLNVSANKDSLTVNHGRPLNCLSPNLTLVYKIARVATWVLAALFIGSLLSVLISAVPQLSSFFQPTTSFVLSLVSPWLQLNAMPLWLKLIFTAFLGGISYILLAVIVVLLTGIVVKILVKDLGKL